MPSPEPSDQDPFPAAESSGAGPDASFCRAAARALGAEASARFTADDPAWHLAEVWGDPLPGAVACLESAGRRAAETGRPAVATVDDAGESALAVLAVPIPGPEGGALAVLDRRQRRWTEAEAEVLAELAALAGRQTSLSGAEAGRSLAEARLRLISSVTAGVVGTGSLPERIRDIARQVREAFAVDGCVLRILEGEALRLLAADGIPESVLRAHLPIGQGISREMLEQRRPLWIPDVLTHPVTRPGKGLPEGYEFRSYAGAPLLVEGQVTGLLGIYTRGLHTFSPADLDHLQTIANHVAVVIANEQLYGEMLAQQEQLRAEVAERERGEAALRRSEERYRHLLDTVNEGIWIVAPDGIVAYANRQLAQMLGCEVEEVVGHPAREFVWADEWEALEERAERRRRGIREQFDARMRRQDGREVWVIISAAPLWDERGYAGSLTMLTDVTARRRAERNTAELMELGRRLNATGSPVEAARVVVDTADRLFGWDACWLQLVEAVEPGRHMLLACDTVDGERVDAQLLRPESGFGPLASRAAAEGPLLIRRRPGEAGPIGWRFGDTTRASATLMVVPIRTPERLVGALSIQSYRIDAYGEEELQLLQSLADYCASALERTRAEAAVRRSEARFRLMTEAAPFGIFVADAEGRCTYLNSALTRVLGLTRDEALGHGWLQAVHPDDRESVTRELTESAGGHRPYSLIHRFQHRDGTVVWVRVEAAHVWEQGTLLGYIGISEDITQQRLLEEQLFQSQKMEAVGRLAGGIAHDFNNMLAVINGYSDLLLRMLNEASPLRTGLQEVQRAGRRAADLTRQLLAYGRRQILSPRVISLNEIISSTELMLRRLIGEDFDLTTELDPFLCLVRADPSQMEQVLMNLIVNARDAMPEGGRLTVETRTVEADAAFLRRHPEFAPGTYARLSVSDSGSGITDEVLPHVFEPFYTTKEPGRGTGLGLATVYGIVRQSEGHVTVETRVGHGTTFRVYLPAVGASEPEREREPAPESVPPGGGETVLLVEDEPLVRRMVRKMLETEGYRVLEAGYGDEALRVSRAHPEPIHLLLTDVVMPGGSDGTVLAEQLRRERPDLRVLLISGYPDDAVTANPGESRDLLLPKPFTHDELAARVRRVLG